MSRVQRSPHEAALLDRVYHKQANGASNTRCCINCGVDIDRRLKALLTHAIGRHSSGEQELAADLLSALSSMLKEQTDAATRAVQDRILVKASLAATEVAAATAAATAAARLVTGMPLVGGGGGGGGGGARSAAAAPSDAARTIASNIVAAAAIGPLHKFLTNSMSASARATLLYNLSSWKIMFHLSDAGYRVLASMINNVAPQLMLPTDASPRSPMFQAAVMADKAAALEARQQVRDSFKRKPAVALIADGATNVRREHVQVALSLCAQGTSFIGLAVMRKGQDAPAMLDSMVTTCDKSHINIRDDVLISIFDNTASTVKVQQMMEDKFGPSLNKAGCLAHAFALVIRDCFNEKNLPILADAWDQIYSVNNLFLKRAWLRGLLRAKLKQMQLLFETLLEYAETRFAGMLRVVRRQLLALAAMIEVIRATDRGDVPAADLSAFDKVAALLRSTKNCQLYKSWLEVISLALSPLYTAVFAVQSRLFPPSAVIPAFEALSKFYETSTLPPAIKQVVTRSLASRQNLVLRLGYGHGVEDIEMPSRADEIVPHIYYFALLCDPLMRRFRTPAILICARAFAMKQLEAEGEPPDVIVEAMRAFGMYSLGQPPFGSAFTEQFNDTQHPYEPWLGFCMSVGDADVNDKRKLGMIAFLSLAARCLHLGVSTAAAEGAFAAHALVRTALTNRKGEDRVDAELMAVMNHRTTSLTTVAQQRIMGVLDHSVRADTCLFKELALPTDELKEILFDHHTIAEMDDEEDEDFSPDDDDDEEDGDEDDDFDDDAGALAVDDDPADEAPPPPPPPPPPPAAHKKQAAATVAVDDDLSVGAPLETLASRKRQASPKTPDGGYDEHRPEIEKGSADSAEPDSSEEAEPPAKRKRVLVPLSVQANRDRRSCAAVPAADSQQ
jgi:hypothetical protein